MPKTLFEFNAVVPAQVADGLGGVAETVTPVSTTAVLKGVNSFGKFIIRRVFKAITLLPATEKNDRQLQKL